MPGGPDGPGDGEDACLLPVGGVGEYVGGFEGVCGDVDGCLCDEDGEGPDEGDEGCGGFIGLLWFV